MGRYISGSSNNGQPRRHLVRIIESNPNIRVPEWARDGLGTVLVTGCGGGASGSVSAQFQTAKGGGAGAYAAKHPVAIPAGLDSISAIVGVGGAAVTGSADTPGNSGGSSILTIGSMKLVLSGGGNGATSQSGSGGVPIITFGGDPVGGVRNGALDANGGTGSANSQPSGLAAPPATLGAGAGGSSGSNGQFSQGGYSLWGGARYRESITNGTSSPGASAQGFGAGGNGAYWASGVSVVTGAGAPGFFELEFVEGVQA